MKSIRETLFILIGKEIESLNIDCVKNSLELIFSTEKSHREVIVFEGVIEFNYTPDFLDFGPWLVDDFKYEKRFLNNIIDEVNLFWTKESLALQDWLKKEIHRLKLISADFELTIIFKELKYNITSNSYLC